MVEPQASVERLERLTGMLRRRGIILPAFEIHGGAKGLYDFGPVGGRLRSKVQSVWRDHWLSQGDVVEISCPTVTPFAVLEASGHVAEFSDFMTVCTACDEASRADTLLEAHHANPDALSLSDLQALLDDVQPPCPACGEASWSPVAAENLMFDTVIGAGSSGRAAFLRPETAQGMFTTYPAIYRHFRERLPFGAMQLGRGYRNEISPRQGMIRLREFNMAELEYFIDPETEAPHDLSPWASTEVQLVPAEGDAFAASIPTALAQGVILHPTVAWFMARTHDLMLALGVDAEKLRFRQHARDEMAHYALDCWDVELHGSYGWIECVGIAHRGCYDLEAHEEATGQRLRAWRNYPEPKVVEINGWTIDGAKAGPAFRALAGQVKSKVEALGPEASFPLTVVLDGGEEVLVEEEHVKRVQRTKRWLASGSFHTLSNRLLASTASFGTCWTTPTKNLVRARRCTSACGSTPMLHPSMLPFCPCLRRRAWTPWLQRFTAACAGRVAFWPVTTEAVPSAAGTQERTKSGCRVA